MCCDYNTVRVDLKRVVLHFPRVKYSSVEYEIINFSPTY